MYGAPTKPPIKENKVVFVGDSGVGKTSIIQRFVTGELNWDQTPTVGAGHVKTEVELDSGVIVELTLWDTAGQERFQSLIPLYLRNAKGVILVADVTANDTIPVLDLIYRSLTDVDPETVMILVANKIDMEESIDFQELRDWAEEHRMSFMTASAKTGEGINDIFRLMACQLNNPKEFIKEEEVLTPTSSSILCCT